MKVLIIEDNSSVVKNICLSLEIGYKNFTSFSFLDEPGALEIAQTKSLDLVFLNVSLTKVDITDLIRKIREFSDVPIVLLGEKKNDMDIAQGLEAGADEYIEIQFTPIELIARCRALIRRCQKPVNYTENSISLDGLTIDFSNHEVSFSGRLVKFTPTEFGLLSELAKNAGRVVTNDNLLKKVWGPEYIGDANLIKTYVYRLRSKLELGNATSIKILSERGIGYRMLKNKQSSMILTPEYPS